MYFCPCAAATLELPLMDYFDLNQPIDHLVNKQWRWRLVWSDMFSSNVTQNDSWIIKMISDGFTVDHLVCVTDAGRLSWKTRSRCMMGKSPPVQHRFGPVLFVLLSFTQRAPVLPSEGGSDPPTALRRSDDTNTLPGSTKAEWNPIRRPETEQTRRCVGIISSRVSEGAESESESGCFRQRVLPPPTQPIHPGQK